MSDMLFPSLLDIMNVDLQVEKKFGLPLDDKAECPICDYEGTFATTIAHLNNKPYNMPPYLSEFDPHNWSFKQIGMWLKELGY